MSSHRTRSLTSQFLPNADSDAFRPPGCAVGAEGSSGSECVTLRLLWFEYREAHLDGYQYSRCCDRYAMGFAAVAQAGHSIAKTSPCPLEQIAGFSYLTASDSKPRPAIHRTLGGLPMIPPPLQEIADHVAATGGSPRRSVRIILSWFGYSRRGEKVLATVKQALTDAGLKTNPDFGNRELEFDSHVAFVPDPKARALQSAESDRQLPQQKTDPDDLEVEGVETKGSTWGRYPIDGLLIRSETRTVYDVVRRIRQGSYVMNPDFQRDFIWKDDKQSRLIESVIMRIPLPVFYLAEDEEGRMVVVDGLQRLSTFERFLNDGLRLRLPDREELHRKRFSDLGPKLQNRIEDCNLTCYVMDSRVPERARLDIFERVNGGVALSRQQMRNCLYMGKATRFLRDEAKSKLFLSATGWSLRSDNMRDREFLNRFCAFQLLGVKRYRGDMDQFLADCLRRMNRMGDHEIAALGRDLRRSLDNNYGVFGKHAFRKRRPGITRRSVINASLWDVMSTGLSRYGRREVGGVKSLLDRAFLALLQDDDFNTAITYATNDDKRVQARFKMTQTMLQGVLGAHSA